MDRYLVGYSSKPKDDIPWLKESPEVVTASIRTDVVSNRAYFERLMKGLQQGWIETSFPFTGKRKVSFSNLKCISFWSKNYDRFIKEWESPTSRLPKKLAYVFNFTINGENHVLENLRIGLDERIDQLRWLVETFGHDAINVRFDPIVHWRDSSGEIMNNLDEFPSVLEGLQRLGIKHLSFSFCIAHEKVVSRMSMMGIPLAVLGDSQKFDVLRGMMDMAGSYGIDLRSCCEDGLVDFEHNGHKILKSICVDENVVRRFVSAKGMVLKAKSHGTRPQCKCVKSTDLFSYFDVCSNGCVYCYATPAECGKKRPCGDIEDLGF